MKSLTLTLAALVASTVVAVAAQDATKSAGKTETVIIAEESATGHPADTSTGTTTESTTTETTTKKKEENKEGTPN